MMTSQILKFVDSLKTQKSEYHGNETMSSNKEIHSLYMRGCNMVKKIVLEVLFLTPSLTFIL